MLPSLAVFKRRELTEKIQGVTEEIEELKNEETAILRTFHKEKAVQKMAAQPSQRKAIAKQARKEISGTLSAVDAATRRHAGRETAFEAEYQSELQRFDELRPEAEALDPPPWPPLVSRSVPKRSRRPLMRSTEPSRISFPSLLKEIPSRQSIGTWMKESFQRRYRIIGPNSGMIMITVVKL